jgi:molybdopterin synthase catalytic subunit
VVADLICVQREDFNVNELLTKLSSRSTGCTVSFLGTVRDVSMGKEVSRMSIEVYENMAVSELERIKAEAVERYGVDDVAIIHRYGDLDVGDRIVFIGVSSGHRAEAFDACRYIIEELKVRVPLWKREYTPDGEVWVEGERPK